MCPSELFPGTGYPLIWLPISPSTSNLNNPSGSDQRYVHTTQYVTPHLTLTWRPNQRLNLHCVNTMTRVRKTIFVQKNIKYVTAFLDSLAGSWPLDWECAGVQVEHSLKGACIHQCTFPICLVYIHGSNGMLQVL